jgi:hypothetical protein
MKQSRTWAVGILILTLLSAPLPLAASDSDTLTVSITITPIDTVVALGDSLDFEGFVTNHTADTLRVDVWFTVTPDSGNEVLVPAVAPASPDSWWGLLALGAGVAKSRGIYADRKGGRLREYRLAGGR